MKKTIIVVVICILLYAGIFIITNKTYKNQNIQTITKIESTNEDINIKNNTENIDSPNSNVTLDWKLTLVNYQNSLPDDFEVELAYVDNSRKFDSRAIEELNKMIKAMRKEGASNIWVQSAYRSIKYQEGLFEDKISYFMKQGYSREKAEKLTLQTINRPGTSEHNLGLAVDFNYVTYDFENTKEFKWLQENAENYGFILRYKKEKEDITKVDYEPWHWRYVGVENAKKINELDMCLEEYIEYLNKN